MSLTGASTKNMRPGVRAPSRRTDSLPLDEAGARESASRQMALLALQTPFPSVRRRSAASSVVQFLVLRPTLTVCPLTSQSS